MPVRPAGIGRPKADADFEAKVYSLEIPMRPCYVRTREMARHVVFPTPEVPIMSGIAAAQGGPMVDRGKCAGSGTGCPGMGPDRRGPAAGPVHPRGGTGCARRARRLRRPPRGLEGCRPLQDAQRDLARGDARGHSQPGCRPGLSRRARGTANRQGARCPALAPPE